MTGSAYCVLTVVAIAGLVLPSVSRSEGEQEPVVFRIRVIQASEQKGQIEPGCEETRRLLPWANFNRMRLLKERRLRLVMGQAGRVDLPTGKRVVLRPISILDQRLHVHLQGPSINGRLRMVPGRPIILGPQHYDGGRLIVRIDPEF